MPHVALPGPDADGAYQCACKAWFGSEDDLAEHIEGAEAAREQKTVELARWIEGELDRYSEHNGHSTPDKWIDIETMCFEIAEKLQKEYFVIPWGTV